MKTKTVPMLIVALAMWGGVAHSQPASPPAPASDTNAPAVASAPDAGTNAAPATPKAETDTNAPVQAPQPEQPAQQPAPPAAPATPAPDLSDAAVEQAVIDAGVAPEALSTNTEEILVQINPSTKLPDAVQLLARLADINYQFDPKLLNQFRPDGTPVPMPEVGVEIRWEHVTAAQALTALLENYNWQLVQDPKSKIARITAKDPAALEPMVTKVIQLKYSNPTNVQAQLTNTLSPRSRLIPDLRTSQMIVLTTEKELPGLEALIDKLDRGTKQVLIEGRLIETTRNPKSLKGIDWTDTLEAQHVSFGNGVTTGTVESKTTSGSGSGTGGNGATYAGNGGSSSSVSDLTTAVGGGGLSANTSRGFSPSTAFLNADGVHAVLSFLNSDTETESLALPRTVAQDGYPTELAVIRNVPIFEQEQSPGSGGQNNLATVKPNYEKKVSDTIINEVGIKLRVLPRIVGFTNVLLDLKPEISAQETVPASYKLNGSVNESPIFSRRKISTLATVPSGFTLVIGGLNNDTSSKTFTKVPILGDIPGIGLAFRHENKERTRQNLLIFVTPTIIEGSDFQETKTQFLKTKFVDKPDTEESAWNSGKPKDWTKPKAKVEPAYAN